MKNRKMIVLLFLAMTTQGCGGKKLIFNDSLAKDAPDEMVEICVFASPEASVDCYNYSIKRTERIGDEPIRVYESVEDLPPGFYLSPEAFAGWRRMVDFFVPASEVERLSKKYDLPKDELAEVLDELEF